MTDMQIDRTTEDQSVTNYGSNRTGVNTTTQTVADPSTGASVRRSNTSVWSGKSPGVEFVWLIAGIVVAFLALDFIFHASGANNVGFASFVFAVGKALASSVRRHLQDGIRGARQPDRLGRRPCHGHLRACCGRDRQGCHADLRSQRHRSALVVAPRLRVVTRRRPQPSPRPACHIVSCIDHARATRQRARREGPTASDHAARDRARVHHRARRRDRSRDLVRTATASADSSPGTDAFRAATDHAEPGTPPTECR